MQMPRALFLAITLFSTLPMACHDSTSIPLRVASSPWPGYEPLYLARDLDYFSPNVHVFEMPSSDITMESFRNGSTDLATLTLDETLTLIHDGVPLKILLVMDISNGGDAALVRPGINNLADIRGKDIAIVNIPLGLYMLSRLLDKAGVERNEVTLHAMPESRQLDFYRRGLADVVITFDPVKTRLINEGARVIFDSSQIPFEIFDLIVVHEAVYQQRRDEVCGVINGWFKALDYIEQKPADATRRMAQRIKVTEKELQGMMSGIHIPDRKENALLLGSAEPAILPSSKHLSMLMLDEGLLARPAFIDGALDIAFVECYQ